jgi:hypothetical protein
MNNNSDFKNSHSNALFNFDTYFNHFYYKASNTYKAGSNIYFFIDLKSENYDELLILICGNIIIIRGINKKDSVLLNLNLVYKHFQNDYNRYIAEKLGCVKIFKIKNTFFLKNIMQGLENIILSNYSILENKERFYDFGFLAFKEKLIVLYNLVKVSKKTNIYLYNQKNIFK